MKVLFYFADICQHFQIDADMALNLSRKKKRKQRTTKFQLSKVEFRMK